jgi:ATP-binding cassette subfamily F protein uup
LADLSSRGKAFCHYVAAIAGDLRKRPGLAEKTPMPAPILQLRDIRLTFGATPLLEGAGFQIEAGDRVCLVGRNGSGKSTLLRIAAGEVEPDSGERFVQPGTTLRYLPQEPNLSGLATVGDYVRSGLGPADDAFLAQLWLSELGIDEHRAPATLSGGELRRAALVRTLAAQPDILLLDEPTNHLDLPAIEWLENRLISSTAAMVIISHDRRFLEKLSRKTVWLDRGITRELAKGFGVFEAWRDEVLEGEAAEAHKLGRKIAREEHWLRYGVTGRRRRNVRRLEELRQMRRRRAELRGPAGDVRLANSGEAGNAALVAELSSVNKRFGDREIVRSLSVMVKRGDRVGIVGPNGAGKTTLVEIVTGGLPPDEGKVRLGAGLEILKIDQDRAKLDPARSLRDALTDGAGDMLTVAGKQRHVIGYLQDFQFLPEQAGTPAGELSGGERARLVLARGLARPSNLLVLDEPTNDLDLETLDVLEEFLADYPGTVLLVSHDRDFLDRICTSILASDGDGVWRQYAGGYSDMVAQRGHGVIARTGPATTSNGKPAPRPQKPQERKAQKLSYKQKFALEYLPAEIEALQAEIGTLRTELHDPLLYARDRARFDRVTSRLQQCEQALLAKEDEWLELELLREEMEG